MELKACVEKWEKIITLVFDTHNTRVGVENGASFEILQVSMSETWESAMPPWMVSMP